MVTNNVQSKVVTCIYFTKITGFIISSSIRYVSVMTWWCKTFSRSASQSSLWNFGSLVDDDDDLLLEMIIDQQQLIYSLTLKIPSQRLRVIFVDFRHRNIIKTVDFFIIHIIHIGIVIEYGVFILKFSVIGSTCRSIRVVLNSTLLIAFFLVPPIFSLNLCCHGRISKKPNTSTSQMNLKHCEFLCRYFTLSNMHTKGHWRILTSKLFGLARS